MRRARDLAHWLCAVIALQACAPAPEPPRSIVLVVIDTLRRDALPVYGGESDTPKLSALAERGVTRDALASFHQTSMSMGALFTGRTPSLESGDAAAVLAWQPASWCGMGRFTRDVRPKVCLPAEVQTLGEAMAERGYYSVGVVGNALLHEPAGFARGFDRWAEVGRGKLPKARRGARAPAHELAQAFARFRTFEQIHAALRQQLVDLPDSPIFLYVHYLDVHDWLYRGLSYAEAVEQMDRGIGELLEILADAKLLDDTAILITSDHGEQIDERPHVLPATPLHLGNPSFREVLDVPFILVGADDLALPERIRSEDVHRILLALTGEPLGSSADLHADELFVSEKFFQTYQRERFKSIRERSGGLTLIDLEEDPGETRDVSELHPEVVKAHRERVDALTATLAAPALPTEETVIDPEWIERLHSLGYLK